MIESYFVCDRCHERMHEDDVPGTTMFKKKLELRDLGYWYWSIDEGDVCNDCWRQE